MHHKSLRTYNITCACLQVEALSGQRVIQVACGSRDAQTLALTDQGKVYSWGDGDFGKLGDYIVLARRSSALFNQFPYSTIQCVL